MRAERLRVGFLAGTLGRGGAERQLVYMLRALRAVGVATRVLCLTRGEPFEEEIRALGVPIEWIGASGSRPARLIQLIKALRREPVDILQSVHFYTNLYVASAGRITGTHHIGAVRNDVLSEIKCNGAIGRFQLVFPRNLISNSELGLERAVSSGFLRTRIHLVRNAVDPEVFHEKRCSGSCDPVIRILFAGRLVEQKRPELFLRIVNEVMNDLQPRPTKAIIAGDGPLRLHLERLGSHLRMTDRLEFLGECSEMAAVYQRADMLVMTSEYEGTPNVLLEAMACRLPVIATSVGGVPEILAEGRGLLVDPADENGLKAAVLTVASDAGFRAELGGRGYEYVSRSHSLEALGRQLTEIYSQILSKQIMLPLRALP
jgi:glycosyltransferase involved in cell wall biosynthesis